MPPTALLQFLASEIITPIVRKTLFGKEYVLFSDYMPRAAFAFEIGAVLGYTFRSRLTIFAQLFSAPGTEEKVLSILHDDATERLSSVDGAPSDFAHLYFAPEATRLIGVLREAGMTNASDWLDMHKVANHKLRVADIFSQVELAFSYGIAFGSRYPDLTARLLSVDIDAAEYQRFRDSGLSLPPSPPKAQTMDQRQEMALSLVRPFVQHARPDLMVALGL